MGRACGSCLLASASRRRLTVAHAAPAHLSQLTRRRDLSGRYDIPQPLPTGL